MSEDALHRLLDAYVLANRKRALGGVWALSGFNYQLRAHLADYVHALIARDCVDVAEANLLEAMSDYATADSDGIVLVQTKRTLTRSTLRGAALEFLAIDEFLEREAPLSRPGVIFEVLARTALASLSWSDVSFPTECAAQQTRFTSLLDSGRIGRIRIEPDPWWRLLVALTNVVDDPFAFANEALEIALQRGDRDAHAIAREILERFTRRRLRHDQPPSGTQLLDASDFQERAELSDALAVGRAPSLALLNDRQYMDQPDHVSAMKATVTGALEQSSGSPYTKLTVVWVVGRSGSGKSAFLLQLMRDLVSDGEDVAWLRDRVQPLLPLLTHYPSTRIDHRLPRFVFIDDLYNQHNQITLDAAALCSLVDENPFTEWPIIVTCGPPDFMDTFQRTVAGSIDVAHWRLPPVTPERGLALKDWVAGRLGREVHGGTAFEQTDGLMISMALELCHGDLGVFARRFQGRLSASGVADALRELLALNRLYIWAPAMWLSPDQVERLEALNRDRDFTFVALAPTAAGYLRLTHPHIADAIYKAVRAPGTREAFARDLVGAFARSLETDLPTAQRLLRAFATGHERLRDVDELLLERGCVAVWNEAVQSGLQCNDYQMADLWTSWAVWSAQSHGPVLAGVSALSYARGFAARVPALWPSLWERLWEGVPDTEDLAHDALAWLQENPDSRVSIHVWERLTESDRLDLLARCGLLPKVLGWGEAWLSGREERPEWSHVWEYLTERAQTGKLSAGASLQDLVNQGYAWLAGRETRPEWSFVWDCLCSVGLAATLPTETTMAGLLDRGYSWLAGREQRPEWSHVWRRLEEIGRMGKLPTGTPLTTLRDRGYAWLEGSEERPDWTFVWQRLSEPWQAGDLPTGISQQDLVDRGYAWLAGREERPEWSHVWERVVKLQESCCPPGSTLLQEVLDFGYTWLAGHADQPGWNYVWQRAVELGQMGVLPKGISMRILLGQGHAWLAGREDGPGWPYVWELLMRAARTGNLPAATSLQDLVDYGCLWLAGREERPEWPFVWGQVCEVGLAGTLPFGSVFARLLDRGYAWLAGREERPTWGDVWKRLTQAAQTGKLPAGASLHGLVDRGCAWLAGREERPDWPYIWESMTRDLQAGSPTPVAELQDLLDQGCTWLEGRDERPEWALVWRRLVDLGQIGNSPTGIPLSTLLSRGCVWLGEHEGNSEWARVWKELADAGQAGGLPDGISIRTLENQGRAWLTGHEEQPGWSFVWQQLLDIAGPTSPDRSLVDAVIPWLLHDRNRSLGEWDKLFEQALELGCCASDLLNLGAHWCLEHKLEPQVAPLASKILLACPDFPSLQPLADWLAGWLREQNPQPTARFAARILSERLSDRGPSGVWACVLHAAAQSALRRWRDCYAQLAIGSEHTGVVTRTRGRRTFALADGAEGMILPTSIAQRLGGADGAALHPGDRVRVVVLSVVPNGMKADFALRAVERSPSADDVPS